VHQHSPDTPFESRLWELCFRWAVGFAAPVLLMALPSVLHIRWRLLRSDTGNEAALLRCYIRFCLAMLWIDLMLRLPAFVRDISSGCLSYLKLQILVFRYL
jgi:hypothetical protein